MCSRATRIPLEGWWERFCCLEILTCLYQPAVDTHWRVLKILPDHLNRVLGLPPLVMPEYDSSEGVFKSEDISRKPHWTWPSNWSWNVNVRFRKRQRLVVYSRFTPLISKNIWNKTSRPPEKMKKQTQLLILMHFCGILVPQKDELLSTNEKLLPGCRHKPWYLATSFPGSSLGWKREDPRTKDGEQRYTDVFS